MTAPLFVTILVGLAVLLFGRQLFWLFVGATGFAVGLHLAPQLFRGYPEWVTLLVALALGLLGALLAAFVQLAAVGVGGFLAGAYALFFLARLFGAREDAPVWIAAVVGGVVGAALALFLLDWALVVLSSLTGAALLTGAVRLPPRATTVVFLVFLAVGIAFQAYQLSRAETPRRASRR